LSHNIYNYNNFSDKIKAMAKGNKRAHILRGGVNGGQVLAALAASYLAKASIISMYWALVSLFAFSAAISRPLAASP